MCTCAHWISEDRWASAEEDASLPEEVLLPRPTHAYEVCSFLPGNLMHRVAINYLPCEAKSERGEKFEEGIRKGLKIFKKKARRTCRGFSIYMCSSCNRSGSFKSGTFSS